MWMERNCYLKCSAWMSLGQSVKSRHIASFTPTHQTEESQQQKVTKNFSRDFLFIFLIKLSHCFCHFLAPSDVAKGIHLCMKRRDLKMKWNEFMEMWRKEACLLFSLHDMIFISGYANYDYFFFVLLHANMRKWKEEKRRET